MNQKLSDLVEVTFGFRKFFLMMLLFVVTVVLRLKGYLDGQQMVDLLKSTVLGFFTANGFEHASLTVKEYFKNKVPGVDNGQ